MLQALAGLADSKPPDLDLSRPGCAYYLQIHALSDKFRAASHIGEGPRDDDECRQSVCTDGVLQGQAIFV